MGTEISTFTPKSVVTTLTTSSATFKGFYNATGIGTTSARGGNSILRLTVPIPQYNRIKMRPRHLMRPQEFQMRSHQVPATRKMTRTTLLHSQIRRTHSTTSHTLSHSFRTVILPRGQSVR
jgi:hypothetical protein